MHERPLIRTHDSNDTTKKAVQTFTARPEQDQTQDPMQDAINLLMLACASLAALAFGVLLAYGICRAAFAVIRMHARSVAAQAAEPEAQSAPQTAIL